jgi:outer membrane protein OmpA-like peptidoglycan-associated protein
MLSPALLESFDALEKSVVALEVAYGVDVAAPAPKPPAPAIARADPCKEKVRLTGVEFAFDSDALTPASDATLKLATDKLKKCAAIAVKIDGYTDSTGAAKFNQELSQKRADAVKAYLVANGIAASRLSATGRRRGGPIAPCYDRRPRREPPRGADARELSPEVIRRCGRRTHRRQSHCRRRTHGDDPLTRGRPSHWRNSIARRVRVGSRGTLGNRAARERHDVRPVPWRRSGLSRSGQSASPG